MSRGGGGGALCCFAVFYRCRYIYINFQVIISITKFFIDNSFGTLAAESPCTFKLHQALQFVGIRRACTVNIFNFTGA